MPTRFSKRKIEETVGRPSHQDLTRQIDRNKLKVMGQVQSPDVVMKNKSTTIYGNIVAFDQSPKNANLLYAGTDDGLIQVSEDGGASWEQKGIFWWCTQHDLRKHALGIPA